MATPSPYRSLSPERRTALVTHAIKASRDSRAIFMHRLASRPGGFRAVTLQSWPPDKLAREVVRLKAETSQDEFDLLHLLYVELEPAIQVAFLDAAGVPHEDARMPDDLEVPYTDAESVERAAGVDEGHGWQVPKNRVDFWGRVEKFLDKVRTLRAGDPERGHLPLGSLVTAESARRVRAVSDTT